MTNAVSRATISRLPIYLNYIKSLDEAPEYLSATSLAAALGFGEVQVRKDLASISDMGKPKLGYFTKDLIAVLEDYLGYNDTHNAIIVGVGRLGQALLAYKGFEEYGLNIVAGFDVNAALVGKTLEGKKIFHPDKLEHIVRRLGIKIGIITVPSGFAQETADKLVSAGIRGIWNFSPTHIVVPENIAIKNENMASSFAMLSNQLKAVLENEK